MARYMVATGKSEQLISMLRYYEQRLERIKEEATIVETDIQSQQNAPGYGMGC